MTVIQRYMLIKSLQRRTFCSWDYNTQQCHLIQLYEDHEDQIMIIKCNTVQSEGENYQKELSFISMETIKELKCDLPGKQRCIIKHDSIKFSYYFDGFLVQEYFLLEHAVVMHFCWFNICMIHWICAAPNPKPGKYRPLSLHDQNLKESAVNEFVQRMPKDLFF